MVYKKYIYFRTIVTQHAQVWQQNKSLQAPRASPHPHSAERFESAIDASMTNYDQQLATSIITDMRNTKNKGKIEAKVYIANAPVRNLQT